MGMQLSHFVSSVRSRWVAPLPREAVRICVGHCECQHRSKIDPLETERLGAL